MPSRPFTIGTKCKTKSKPSRFCEIVGVDKNATRKNVWTIKFADDGSLKESVRSQQLLKLSDTDAYPTPSISGSEGGTEDTALESESNSDLEDFELFDLSDSESLEPVDPDDAGAEDIDQVINDKDDPEYYFNHQDLEDEEKHTRSTKKYKKYKEKLLAETWTVEVESGEAKLG